MLDNNTHVYDGISKENVAEMLKELAAHGSTVTGTNPWAVVTSAHGVTLRGEWDEAGLVLTITITGADWYVARTAVWQKIDTLMRSILDAE